MCLKLKTGLFKCIHRKSQFNFQRTEPNKNNDNQLQRHAVPCLDIISYACLSNHLTKYVWAV